MVCVESERLERAYEKALRVWAEYVRPQAVVPPGHDQLQRAYLLRQKALVERNAAANRLYAHRQSCAICKQHEVRANQLAKK